ncbi:MAG: fatty-acid oxidation protein subunit alpha [Bacteroidetes bacterium]|nr:MAG: fatty-acid oxidation protein subunit alpha [Bacteroidota bacterium]TAG86273.1 MAG: fatty-acid oxidation protein subunit alpha [Bacteroidota bacterium]
MSRKDRYHDVVKQALENEGWLITHEQLVLKSGRKNMYIDLGAELLVAEKENIKIAVEVKSFTNTSEISDFHSALGQFNIYKLALTEQEPNRTLYLAIPDWVYEELFEDKFMQRVLINYSVLLILFNNENKKITKWIPNI